MAVAVSLWKTLQQEFFKVGLLAVILVLVQLILSLLGVVGLGNTVFLYVVASFASSVFIIDSTGIKSTYGIYLPSWMYWVFLLMDLFMIGLGIILWFTVGLIQGVESTVSAAENPDQILQKMAGDNFLLKLLYAFISHYTIMSFLRIWVNLGEAILSLFPSGGGGRRR